MGTTPIYGFPYPDPSDLVANYPALGQELAEDIEAVLPTLGGTVRLATNTFSAQSSVSINTVFSATYDHYRIIAQVTYAGGATQLRHRLRVAGADNASNNYYFNGMALETSSANTFDVLRSAGLQSSFNANQGTGLASVAIDLFGPFTATRTAYTAQAISQSSTDMAINSLAGIMSVTTSYDSISFFPNTGTIAGTIRIYGYKNS